MKRCFKCLCEKPLDSFYKHAAMADGHLNKCKDCTKKDVNAHRQENLVSIRAYDRMRGSMPHRIAANKARSKQSHAKLGKKLSMLKYREEHPERSAAHFKVGNAIRDGKLEKLPCLVCGASRSEAHHPDYSSPLDVVWLCNQHHRDAHKLTREIQRNAT